MRVFFDLSWFFKERKKQYAVGVIMLLLVALLQLLPPKIIGFVVDAIGAGTLTAGFLLKWLGILAAAAVGMYVLRYWWRQMIFGSALVLARNLRKDLYRHFTQMSPSFYQKRRVGDLMAHATNDLQAVQQTASSGVLTLVDSIVTGGFVIAAMAITINWKLTLIVILPFPVMIILTSWYGRLLHERFHGAQEAFSDLNDKTQESISGVKVLKTFGQEQEDIDDFKQMSADVVEKNIRVAKIDSLFDPTISAIIGICYLLTIGFGSYFVINGGMTVGDLIAFTAYLGLLVWPMLAFGWLFNIVERGRASYDRIRQLLAVRPDIEDREGAIDRLPAGDLSFNIGSFRFEPEEEPVLRDVRFELKEGETLGIAGKTGSGKTAILRLLLREFEGYEGEITYGKVPLPDFRKQRLREAIGYVPQDHFLFSMSIRDNIAFARPEATDSEVMEAAKLAHIHEDILLFPKGYDTVVGERGVSLSGGQKQRVSIARALISEPELLILDDSLSAVDARTEEAILESLKKARTGETTIITSHRLSAIQHAHLILVMHEGTVEEAGTHEELMMLGGRYREMYDLQQLEALVEQGGVL
ncbi:ABC transporter ATP-binding protein [Indiicoccus explosivorum]|uniref:ABC transporter ATP-binding protein n=1 Tax=Indiicoccus explosivorum TaxID=1917864 RepID=UPI000B449E18|nr:ABC transporter transmembrane domain-containing protein [Indiicoccus explosivorum]